MSQENRSNKGGATSTLALVIALIALIISLFALNRTTDQKAIYEEIRQMQEGAISGTRKASEKMERLVRDTAEVLEKISGKIEKKSQSEKEQNTTE